jgi:hypothetical protein
VIVSDVREKNLGIAIGQQLAATARQEASIIAKAAINQNPELTKVLIEDAANALDPTVTVSATPSGVGLGVTIDLPSPARGAGSLLTSTIDTRSQIAANRIDGIATVNGLLDNAAIDYSGHGVDNDEVVRSTLASASLGIELYRRRLEQRR